MVINHNFEEQLHKLISEAQNELNQVDEQLKSLGGRRLSLAEELQSYEHSLRGYLRRIGKEKVETQPVDWNKVLNNCQTHKQRLLAIAEHNGGELRLNLAVTILYNGKYVKSKSRSNAYVQMYNIIMGMVDKKEMERFSPGRYRLTKHSRLL